MSTVSAELLFDSHCQLGESPTWDDRVQRLYFVDINSQKLHIFDPEKRTDATVRMPEMISTIIPSQNINILVATLHRTVIRIDLTQQARGTVLATVPEDHGTEGWRFNDGKAGPGGVLILGRMHLSDNPEPGRLYSLDPSNDAEKAPTTLLPSIGLPNGMAWDTTRQRMYFNETLSKTVFIYEADEAGVPISFGEGKLKEIGRLNLKEGAPDGMTIDTDGNLWIALADQDFVACYAPDTGQLLHKVSLPVKGPTACTFGGKDLNKLFITTMAEGGGSKQGEGGLYVAEIAGVKGIRGAYLAAIS